MTFERAKIGAICILVSQSLERIVYYSILANFLYTLNSKPLQWSLINSINATFILSGFCFVATMFGGILSDTILKKSTTVLIGYLFYSIFAGYIIIFSQSKSVFLNMTLISGCSISSSQEPDNMFFEDCSNIIIPVTVCTAIGSGLIKSVVVSIGADLANNKWKNPSTFYNMYYWCLNFGSLVAYGGISYIQQNISRFYGFLIPGIALILSFCAFIAGMPYYVHIPKAEKSTINLIFSVYLESFRKKMFSSSYKNSENTTPNQIDTSVRGSILSQSRNNSHFHRSEYSSFESSFASECGVLYDRVSIVSDANIPTMLKPISFLDRSSIKYGGSFKDEEVKNVQRFTNLLIILIYLLPYWILYFQMETTFLAQGLRMELQLDKTNNSLHSIPVCWLSIMDILAIMILLPILVKYVYPFLRKKNIYPYRSTSIIFGMILGIISVVIAGVLQVFVLRDFKSKNIREQNIGGTFYNHSHLSVFYQIPQYLVMGISETQAIVAGLELACTQVPSSMLALSNGIFWFISGLGSFVGTGIVKIFDVENLYSSKGNFIKTRYYFFWIALIQLISLVLFLPYIKNIRKREKEQFDSTISILTIIDTE